MTGALRRILVVEDHAETAGQLTTLLATNGYQVDLAINGGEAISQVIPRAMLLQHVWDLHFDPATNIIDVYVGRLRRKLDSEHAYPLIHTVRGVGYYGRAPC